jgi:hypothetical protein
MWPHETPDFKPNSLSHERTDLFSKVVWSIIVIITIIIAVIRPGRWRLLNHPSSILFVL